MNDGTAHGVGPSGSAASVRAARVLLQALAALGLREVVLAPGSRSAPLAYAAAEAARDDARRDPAAPRLALHVRVDERDAAFLALGLARGAAARGEARPVAVVTTSGTAVANLHPAVLEANHSGVPLLLLTADRPHELRGTGANQTTEQVGLLAPGVRLTLDVPAPTGRPGEDRDLRHLAARAVAAALGHRTADPGPVHLNLAFREPLVPDGEGWPERSDDGLTEVVRGPVLASERAGRVGSAAGPRPSTAPLLPGGAGAGARPTGDGVRTVVVAGDGAGPLARRVAEANDWPLLAEPSSGARGGSHAIPAYRLLLDEPELGGAIERVVLLGRPTLSRQVQALLGRRGIGSLVIAPHGGGWPDAVRNAHQVLTAVPPDLLDGNLGEGTLWRGRPWLAAWQEAGSAALGEVRRVLADRSTSTRRLPGPAVAAEVAASLGPDGVLVVGSSSPVRDLDLVATWAEPPLVLANRGLAGIDGMVSTAAGVALALDRPVRALLGDLTLVHDVGGLLVGPLERRPDLQVVVAHDDGGAIFATLEHGDPDRLGAARAQDVERVFGTPHGVRLAQLCAAYGVGHTPVHGGTELRRVLAEPFTGLSVVEVAVDRVGRRDLGTQLAAAVLAVLAAR